MSNLSSRIRAAVATMRKIEAAGTPGPWAQRHYIPHQPMIKSISDKGALNSFFTGIDVAGRKERRIAEYLDYRENRPPDDPGPSGNATLIIATRNTLLASLDVMEVLATMLPMIQHGPDCSIRSVGALLRRIDFGKQADDCNCAQAAAQTAARSWCTAVEALEVQNDKN